MTGYRKNQIRVVSKCLLIVGALTAIFHAAEPAAAQSIRIQSWNSRGVLPYGGIGIGAPLVVPFGSYGYRSHHYRGFTGIGVPGFAYGFGVPYQSFSLSLGSPYGYDPFGYQNDYYDYRSDYNRRLYDLYQRDLQRDLYYSAPGLDLGGVAPYGLDLYSPFDDVYRPPVTRIEPFDGMETVIPPPYGDIQSSTPARNLPEALRAAANRLSISLSRRRDDGDVWLDYLAPGRIIATIDQNLSVENVSDLLQNFDGVVGNPELRAIATADGFEATRRLLRQWVDAAIEPESDASVAPAPKPSRSVSSPPLPGWSGASKSSVAPAPAPAPKSRSKEVPADDAEPLIEALDPPPAEKPASEAPAAKAPAPKRTSV